MLAPGILGGSEVFLANPDHAGTAVPVLLLLMLLSVWGRSTGRAVGRRREWRVPAAVGVLLTLAQVGDELTLVAATVPLAAVCAARLVAARLSGGHWASADLTASGPPPVGTETVSDSPAAAARPGGSSRAGTGRCSRRRPSPPGSPGWPAWPSGRSAGSTRAPWAAWRLRR